MQQARHDHFFGHAGLLRAVGALQNVIAGLVHP
jgi:hypothetical protein